MKLLDVNFYKVFYWMTVADNAKIFFIVFMSIFTAVCAIATIYFFVGRNEDGKCPEGGSAERAKKWMWWGYPFMIFFWCLFVLTPSKKDSLLILAGGGALNYFTTDSTGKQIPHELSTFVVSELKNMAKQAQVDLGIATEKDRILEEAKAMTVTQLMDRARVDSNFAKVVLNR